MNDSDYNSAIALQPFEPMADVVYSIEAVVHITQTRRHQIGVYCRHGLISPITMPERDGWWFDHEAIRALRRIESLRIDYGMNLEALQIITNLFKEIDRLREEVRTLNRG